MKKYLIPMVMLAAFSLPGAMTQAQTSQTMPQMTPIAMPSPAMPACIALMKNLMVGSRDMGTETQVSALQAMLFEKGHLKVKPTGYFGPLTAAAVKQFQAANGVPATGFVGPMTRARILVCQNHPTTPGTPTSIQIISPKGGEIWTRGTTQWIKWTDSNTYIQAPKYDVKIQQDLDCKYNGPCIALYPMPYTIATGVLNTTEGISWNVGTVINQSGTLPDAKYRIFVCSAGSIELAGCVKSASYITIATLGTTSTSTRY